MKKIITQVQKIFQSPLFRKWFFLLFALFASVIFCFTFYSYHHFKKNLQSEFTSYSKLLTERVTTSTDDSLDRARLIMNALSESSNVRIYMYQERPSELISDVYSRISYENYAYINSLAYVDSIYLYSPASQTIMENGAAYPQSLSSFKDTNWLDHAAGSTEDSYILFARKKNDHYPCLLTMLQPLKTPSGSGTVLLNLDFSKMSFLSTYEAELMQSLYIVTDDGKILYRNNQEDILESLEVIDELSHFDGSQDSLSTFIDSSTPYVYVQQHSDHYPWYYISVTYINEYSSRLSDISSAMAIFLFAVIFVAAILTFFFVILSSNPLRVISEYLEMPTNENLESFNSPEIRQIIQHVMVYIRTNETLSKELENQVDLQNKATLLALQSQINPHFLFNTLNTIRTREIESLGYDHDVPALTLRLSRLLQYALDSIDLVPLETEFYYTGIYLDILNERYQKQLHFDIDVADDVSHARIPKLTLQPLIENAVFHGFSHHAESSNRLTITAVKSGTNCVLTVSDNGLGIPQEKLKALLTDLKDPDKLPSSSIGLHNTALRMHLLFGTRFKIDIQSTVNEGTSVHLQFPIIEASE